MSLQGSFLSDEQFQCSICLDVFTNPTSTPCGHSFCMNCISRYWDGSTICHCPLCKRTFQKRPDLQINRTLREITEQFKSTRGGSGPMRENRGGRGERGNGVTSCSLFNELKKKLPRKLQAKWNREAQGETDEFIPKSLASSVPNDSPFAALINTSKLLPLPPPHSHYSGRRRFTVTGAASSQGLPLCDIHLRGKLIYCRDDRECICPNCEEEDHQGHDTVTVEDEWMENKAQISVSEQVIQEMIEVRIRKMEEIRKSMTELKSAVDRETMGSICLFSALISAVERSQAELLEVTEMSRRAAERQADAMIGQLELEVKELRRRESTLAELAQLDDPTHCVKIFSTLSSPPPTKDWSVVSVHTDLGTGSIYRALEAQIERFQEQLKTTAETGFPASVLETSPVRTEIRTKRIQEYAMDVTLDFNTAHPRLIMSEDMKSVWCGDRNQLLPDNKERFDRIICVLGREIISAGRHYWEVEVGGKTDWDLGVAKQSIKRKGRIDVAPSNGYWFLSLRDKNKYAFRSTDVNMNLPPQKIGIFVDFESGQVSFYNVDARIHIYTFNDTFNESICPFFSPCSNKYGKNDGPLIITPVMMME